VGIDVLIGLVGFFIICVVLFVIWWFFIKRRATRAEAENAVEERNSFAPYRLARKRSIQSLDDPSSISTTLSSRVDEANKTDVIELGYGEFGHRTHEKLHDVNDPWDPRNYSMAFRDSIYEPEQLPASRSPEPHLEAITRPDHQRTTSELRNSPQSVTIPLLARPQRESRSNDLTEFGLGNMSSMAGVGTAARGSKIDTEFRSSRVCSVGSNVTAYSSSSQRPSSSKINPPSIETEVGHGS